jgi:hypothetical protein
MQIAKVPSLKGSILCCVGGGAFKFKEERKNHGVHSEDDRGGVWEQKGCGKKDKATTMNGQIESRATTSPPSSMIIHWKPFYDLLADDSNYIS